MRAVLELEIKSMLRAWAEANPRVIRLRVSKIPKSPTNRWEQKLAIKLDLSPHADSLIPTNCPSELDRWNSQLSDITGYHAEIVDLPDYLVNRELLESELVYQNPLRAKYSAEGAFFRS